MSSAAAAKVVDKLKIRRTVLFFFVTINACLSSTVSVNRITPIDDNKPVGYCKESLYLSRVVCFGGVDNLDARVCAGKSSITLHVVSITGRGELASPNMLSTGNRVTYFQLIGSDVRTIHYDFFANETSVETLNLANNKIEYLDVRLFMRFTNLKYIDLTANPFKRFSGTVKLFNVETIRRTLRHINLINTKVTGPGGMILGDFGPIATTTAVLCVPNAATADGSATKLVLDYIKNTCVCKTMPCIPIEFTETACLEQFQYVTQYKIPKIHNPKASKTWCASPFSKLPSREVSTPTPNATTTSGTQVTESVMDVHRVEPSVGKTLVPGSVSTSSQPQRTPTPATFAEDNLKVLLMTKHQDSSNEEPVYTLNLTRSSSDVGVEYTIVTSTPKLDDLRSETLDQSAEPKREVRRTKITKNDVIIIVSAAVLAFVILYSTFLALGYRFRIVTARKHRDVRSSLISQSKSYELPKYQNINNSRPSLCRATPNQLRLLEDS